MKLKKATSRPCCALKWTSPAFFAVATSVTVGFGPPSWASSARCFSALALASTWMSSMDVNISPFSMLRLRGAGAQGLKSH